jgi:hypothetical protein
MRSLASAQMRDGEGRLAFGPELASSHTTRAASSTRNGGTATLAQCLSERTKADSPRMLLLLAVAGAAALAGEAAWTAAELIAATAAGRGPAAVSTMRAGLE